MSTGRRCPNAALPSSRYCGLDSHQALANQAGDVMPAVEAEAGAGGVESPVEIPAEDALDEPVEQTS
jgi:N utilization substance protein A